MAEIHDFPNAKSERPHKPAQATVTGEVPAEAPDARHLRSDNLRPLSATIPADLVDGDSLSPAEVFAAAQQSRKGAEHMALLLELKHEFSLMRARLKTAEAVLDVLMEEAGK